MIEIGVTSPRNKKQSAPVGRGAVDFGGAMVGAEAAAGACLALGVSAPASPICGIVGGGAGAIGADELVWPYVDRITGRQPELWAPGDISGEQNLEWN